MKKLGTLAISIVLGMSMIGCSSKVDKNENIATVNGNRITVGNYESILALNKQRAEMYYGNTIWDQEIEEGVKYRDSFKNMILDQMIYTESVYEAAKKENLLPTDEDVNKEIEKFKEGMKDNKEYQKEMENMGINDEFLKFQFTRDLASEKYKANFEKKNPVTDEEIKTYYEKNKKDFYLDEVKASHILIKTIDDQNKPLGDKEKAEAKKKAEEVLAKVKAGEEFSKLAKEYSQDGSAQNGGDLGFFGKGQMVKPFEEAAFSMKVGEVSDIVETEYGYHIIKVTDIEKGQKALDDKIGDKVVKDTIKTNLQNQKYNSQVEKLKKDSKVEKNEEILEKIEL
ncbi:MAG: peptidylprolyl isomerase [Peptostreptococcaceae bacterium]